MTDKTVIVFAGANGSGKTTAAGFLLPSHSFKQFVNADEIARGLSPFAPETQRIEAGRLVLKRMRELINANESFAYETTLSGRSQLKWLKDARERGYKIIMHYIHTADVAINLERVQQRVMQKGHPVPEQDIRRRYDRSLRNIFTEYGPICDIVEIYDNSENRLVLFARKPSLNGDYKIFDQTLWDRITE